VALTLVFLTCLASGLWSDNSEVWLDRTRVRLPFLALPIIAMSFRTVPLSWLMGTLRFFVLVAVVSAGGVIVNYLVNPVAVNEAITRGGHIPVPVNHIRYSVLLALAAVTSFYLFDRERVRRWERWLFLVVGLLLAVTLHVLAVRSGLVAFYVAMIFVLLRALFVKRKWLLGLGMIAALVVAPLVAYHTIDSFRSRVDYMKHDLRVFFSGETPPGYSDIKRIVSMRVGMEVAQQAPVFGVGMGDLQTEMDKAYQSREAVNYVGTLPHNQFIIFLASTGVIGLILCVIGMTAVMFTGGRARHWPFVAITLLLLTSCLFEPTVEVQLGVAMYVFTTMLWVVLLKKLPDAGPKTSGKES
jgi:O-antigen ligase